MFTHVKDTVVRRVFCFWRFALLFLGLTTHYRESCWCEKLWSWKGFSFCLWYCTLQGLIALIVAICKVRHCTLKKQLLSSQSSKKVPIFFSKTKVNHLYSTSKRSTCTVMVPSIPVIYINPSESKVPIMLLYQLCSSRYTVIQIKNCSESTSVIKVATKKNTDDFRYAMETITWRYNHQIDTFCCQQKWIEHKRGTLVSPWRMHCMYCSIPKGTLWAEVMLNSEKSSLYP